MADQPTLTAAEAIAKMKKLNLANVGWATAPDFERKVLDILARTNLDGFAEEEAKQTISKLRRKVDQQKETLDSLHTRCASLKSSNRNKASQVARLKKELEEAKRVSEIYADTLNDLGKLELPAIERAEPGAVCSNDAGDTAASPGDVGEAPPLSPVEPLDWPDSPGVWSRDGDTFFVNHETLIWIDGTWHGKYGRGCDAIHGGWVKCTVTAPPVKEPEPIPEKPLRLFAYDGIRWQWYFQKSYDRYVYEHYPGGAPYRLKYFTEIDESASDPEAVNLWRESRQ